MKKFLFVAFLFFGIFACASHYHVRFELDSKIYTEGVRFVEFKTRDVDVAYKVIEADEDTVIFNVYFTNISKRTVTVDSSLFYIQSLNSKETVTSEDPEDLSGVDKSDFFTRTVLKPDDSAGGQVRFSMKESAGHWVLKNKLTSHAFNFSVKEQ